MLNCILCLNKTFQKNAKGLEDTQEDGSTIKDLLKIHFWFSNNILDNTKDSTDSVVCKTCWTKLENFHEFFCAVKFNYHISDEEQIEEVLNESFEKEWKKSLIEKSVEVESDIIQEDNDDVFVKFEVNEENVQDLIEFDVNSEENESEEVHENTQTRKLRKRSASVKEDEVKAKRVKVQVVKKESADAPILTEEDENVIKQHADLKCDLCTFEFSGWNSAKEHYKSAHRKRSFIRCCGRKIERLVELIDHANWHRDPNIFSCKVCGKATLARDHLEIHEAIHVPVELRDFPCPDCDKKFASSFKLLTHRRIHKIAKLKPKFACATCDKLFKTESQLKIHINAVHETGGPFMCEFCSKVLKTKYTLEKHVKSHTQPEAPIPCDICGHYLKNKYRFAIHMSRHKEEEKGPYPCEECLKQGIRKKFKQKHQLQSHIKFVHTTNKFRCEECGKEFKHKKSLEEHSAQHTGIDRYSCPFCTRTFKSNANMHSHKKKMHPEEYATILPPAYLRPPLEVSAENDE